MLIIIEIKIYYTQVLNGTFDIMNYHFLSLVNNVALILP